MFKFSLRKIILLFLFLIINGTRSFFIFEDYQASNFPVEAETLECENQDDSKKSSKKGKGSDYDVQDVDFEEVKE